MKLGLGLGLGLEAIGLTKKVHRSALFIITTHEPMQVRNVTIHEKPKQEPIVLTCKRCQNVWTYQGNNPYVAKCSFCKTSVSVKKHRVGAETKN
jgi:hypothetical protein